MPQTNDADIIQLYASASGEAVADNEPNTGPPGGPAADFFDVHLQAVAGNAIGNGGGNYKLRVDCIDDTLAEPNTNMSPGELDQEFTAPLWEAGGGDTGNFVSEQTFNIEVDDAARGHVLHYVATLVGDNGDVVSFAESEQLIVV
jgi:hypothetical protein